MSQNAVHPTAANEARLQAAARQRNQQNAPSLPFQASDTAEQQRFNGLLKQAEKLQTERAEGLKQAEARAAARFDAADSAASVSPPDAASGAEQTGAAEREVTLQEQQSDAALLAALTPTAMLETAQQAATAEGSTGAGTEQTARGAAPDAAPGAANTQDSQPSTAALAQKPGTPADLLQRWQAQERGREALARDAAAGAATPEDAAPLRDTAAVLNSALTAGMASSAANAAGAATSSAMGLGSLAVSAQDPSRSALADALPTASGEVALDAALQAFADGGAGGSGTSGQDNPAGNSSLVSTPGGNPAAAARQAGGDAFASLLNTSSPAAGTPTPQPAGSAMAQAMGDGFNQLGAQVSLWASQNLRRASLSLQGADGQPIEVDVTLKDGQASLAFRTDDSAARAALQNFGQQALSQMLEQYGLDLSALSVDARASDGMRQGPDQGQAHASASQPSLAAARALRGLSGDGTAGAASGLSWTSKTPSALDVYV